MTLFSLFSFAFYRLNRVDFLEEKVNTNSIEFAFTAVTESVYSFVYTDVSEDVIQIESFKKWKSFCHFDNLLKFSIYMQDGKQTFLNKSSSERMEILKVLDANTTIGAKL